MTERPMSALQPYVPRLVLDWQRSSPAARVREIEGSMVFVDVSGFTQMSERLARQGKVGAEEVAEVIGATFGRLLGEAYAFGGSLIKFGGDALLLFFEGADHPRRAVAAAHAMRADLRRLGAFATTAGKVTLRMSVGAHTGPFHFFLAGGSHRELIVAGPSATETVAMEGAASAGQILLSPALAAALPRANRGRALGPGVLLAGVPPDVERHDVVPAPPAGSLEQLVPVALRDTVLAGDVEPEHRSVTIAFLHFGAFDELVAADGPEAAADALDELVGAVQRAVDPRGVAFLGSDIAPDGGKLILTGGAPAVTGADEESVLLAARTVLAGGGRLPLRIGVHTGPVFAGTIGPPYRRTYTVMGDAVNLAARLMARAEHGRLVATPQVLAASRTLFDAEQLAPFRVKGKRQPVEAVAVGDARGSRASIAETGLPLVGRERELAALASAWRRAAAGAGVVVTLSAEPGMGKTRLLDEFLGTVQGADVLRGDCRLYQATTPYFPFRALLREALGLTGLDDGEAVRALTRAVRDRAPDLVPWLSLLGVPLDLEIEPSPAVRELDDEFRRPRLEQAVVELLAGVLSEPTVLVVEDTHWLDEPSRDLLARITSALGDRPWLVLLTQRTDGAAERADGEEAADEAVHIELPPLDLDRAAALIDAATVDRPLTPHRARALAARAAGNPLFLLELLDALRRGEDVDALPHSVEGLIQARIDRLPVADRTSLRELAVLGSGFRVEHATSVLARVEADGVRAAIGRLADFVALSDGWVQFRHALIRDAAYEGLPYRKRRLLHAQVGDSIRAAAGDDPEDAAELLSVHYSAAARWDEAWTYSRLAGDRARDVYANVEAAQFYERALAAAPRAASVDADGLAEVAARLGESLEQAGSFTAALEHFRRARKLMGDDAVALAGLAYQRARVLTRTGSFRAAFRETLRGYRSLEAVPGLEASRMRARLRRLSGALRLLEGRPRAALELAEKAVREAEAAHDRAELANAYAVLDGALTDLSDGAQAERYATMAVEIYSELGDLPGLGTVEVSIGVRAYAEGRWRDALAAYRRAEDAYRRAGNEAQAALAAANIGEVLVSQGRFGEARALLAEATRVLRAHGSVGPALFCQIQEGRLGIGTGGLEEAAATLAATRAEAVAIGSRGLALEAGVALAAALTRRGEGRRALDVLREEEARAGELASAVETTFACARAETLLALGRVDEAAAVVASGLASADDHDALFDRARLLVLRGRVERARGGSGAEALQESVELLQRLDVIAVPCAYGSPR